MKPSGDKDFAKRDAALPLHTHCIAGIDNSASSRDHRDFAVTPLTNNKNPTIDHSSAANTPPAEASVSPEITLTTPAPAAAEHHHLHTVISGITDNRKCRPRGLLAASDTHIESNDFHEISLPFPSQASMHWLRDNYSPTDSKCSPNVMRTPTSAGSDSLLDSLAAIDFSFEFDTASVTDNDSVDLTRFRAAQLLFCSVDGNDDNEDDDDDDGGNGRFDRCRCLSDGDDDEDPGFVFDDIVEEPEAERKGFGNSGSCAESMSTDRDGPPLASSKDSDWDFDPKL